MLAKKLLVAVGVAVVLWLWWTIPLASLRRGAEEAAEREREAKQAVTASLTPLVMNVADAQSALDEYDALLKWVGDPLSQSNEADFMDVCPKMRQRLADIVGAIPEGNYKCTVGQAQPAAGDARKLPLSLTVRTPAEGSEQPAEKIERLILAVEEDPTMLLLAFTASEDDPATLGTDDQGNPIPPGAHIELTVHLYVKATPTETDLAAAQDKADDRAEALESDRLFGDLMERPTRENQRE